MLGCESRNYGSNPAKTIFIFYVLFLLTFLLTQQKLHTVFFKCVAKVASIFSLDRYETLDFRFDVLILLLCDAVQSICR